MAEQPLKTSTARFTKKRVALCTAVGLLAAVIGLLVANYDSTPMPSYQGKTASEWLYEVNGMRAKEQSEAFRQMGSNAVPFLAHELARKDSPWEKFCFWIYPKLPSGIRKHLSLPLRTNMRHARAAFALGFANSRTAIPPILRLITEGDKYQRLFGLGVLDSLVKPDDTNCIPQLTICLRSPDPDICFSTAAILIKLHSGELAIPALTNFLVRTNIFVLTTSSDLLKQIDPTNATKWREMVPYKQSLQDVQQTSAPK